jgi:hypothetical protein
MFDKLQFYKEKKVVSDDFSLIIPLLHDVKEQISKDTGEVKICGYLDSLKVVVGGGGVLVMGSLNKFYYEGSNIYPLNLSSTAQAIEKVEDCLHLSIDDAKVSSIEFGTNFLLKNLVCEYLKRLGGIQKMDRLEMPNSVYYKHQSKSQRKVKTFAFYDKIQQAKKEKMDFPTNLTDANFLRYEMRFKHRLASLFKVPEVNISILTNPEFYRMLIRLYQDFYFSINKHKQLKTNHMEEIKNAKDGFSVFVARLLTYAPPQEAEMFIEELKRNKVYSDAKYYTRLKQMIADVSSKNNFTMSDELIKELDDNVRNVGAYI